MPIPSSTIAAFKAAVGSILLAGLLLTGQSASAGLVNPDFSAGFVGWEGEVIIFDFGTGTDSTQSRGYHRRLPQQLRHQRQPGHPSQPPPDGASDTWSVLLYQDFMFDPIAAGATLQLALSVATALTDSSLDFAFAQLRDLSGGLATLDLSAGGVFDVTAWIGVNATLEFGVQDGDFVLPDSLTVSGITVTEQPGVVPLPSSLLLLGLGLLVLRRMRH